VSKRDPQSSFAKKILDPTPLVSRREQAPHHEALGGVLAETVDGALFERGERLGREGVRDGGVAAKKPCATLSTFELELEPDGHWVPQIFGYRGGGSGYGNCRKIPSNRVLTSDGLPQCRLAQ